MLKVEHTVRSYSGKPGCMCGCMGTYNESARVRKMAITQMTKDSEVRLQTWDHNDDSDAGCLYIRTETRNRVLYLTREGVDAALAQGITEKD